MLQYSSSSSLSSSGKHGFFALKTKFRAQVGKRNFVSTPNISGDMLISENRASCLDATQYVYVAEIFPTHLRAVSLNHRLAQGY